ncbi:MAG: DUF4198 domain-containing protein [Bryobacteraceae bacterium]|nr:DUF4198 domain-containing protein [Bryobacteraceae bacterium]MDW8376555.1 DUF4198 domain-containing protein [Bryobacterales bacterium]
MFAKMPFGLPLMMALAPIALAHYTWIAPVGLWQPGKLARVEIGHGHQFPTSEESINAKQVQMFALAPSGERIHLNPGPAGRALAASFLPKEDGVYRIAFIQDRGVTSRTAGGVKPGGRKQNPNALSASRRLRTAVAYRSTNKGLMPAAKPLGLELELCAEFVNGSWSLLVLRQGKPLAGAKVEVLPAGATQAVELGRTGASGRLRYEPPANAKGPLLFSAELEQPAEPGSDFDKLVLETSLSVNW